MPTYRVRGGTVDDKQDERAADFNPREVIIKGTRSQVTPRLVSEGLNGLCAGVLSVATWLFPEIRGPLWKSYDKDVGSILRPTMPGHSNIGVSSSGAGGIAGFQLRPLVWPCFCRELCGVQGLPIAFALPCVSVLGVPRICWVRRRGMHRAEWSVCIGTGCMSLLDLGGQIL